MVYNKIHKKVLLRERKRHTARRVASARYAGGGGGYPVPGPRGGGPHAKSGGGGVVPSPRSGWGGGTKSEGGTPSQVWVGGGTKSEGGTPSQVLGEGGIPSRPGWGVYPGGVPPSQTWDGVPPPSQIWDGVPPSQTWDGIPPQQVWTDTQTRVKTLPSLVLRTRALKMVAIEMTTFET